MEYCLDSLGGDRRVKKRLVIDARMVFPQTHGIGRYVKNLAIGLAEIEKERGLAYEPVFLVGHKHPGLLPNAFEAIPVRAPFLNPSELIEIPSQLKRLGADLYHSPSFSSLAYSPCPWIATIHDLNHLKFGNMKQKIYYRLLLKRFAKNARALLTVSEFAKSELSEWLLLPTSQIEVVYNALESGFVNQVQISSDSARKEFQNLAEQKGWKVRSGEYLICLSNSKPHKNLPHLIDSYVKAAGPASLPLLISVGPSEVAIPANGQVILTSHLNDIEARLVLAHARAAVFPSQYEGFGLGPLEAMVGGTPLLVSDIAPHREGLRDFAVKHTHWMKWLKSDDLTGWSEAISDLAISDPAGMRVDPRFAAARKAALDRYSVKRLAEHMDRIYTNVLGMKA